MKQKKVPGASIGKDLTKGKILPTLLTFAIPLVLTNLIQQIYGIADLIIIGKYVGNRGTVGVSTGGYIVDMLTSIANAFATAGQIYIAQLVGAKNKKETEDTICTILSFMLLTGGILMGGCILLTTPLLRLLNCPEPAFEQATAYMRITAIGLPCIFGYNAICGILRGMGESRKPLLFVSVAASINILLDLFLVVNLKMEADGTAIATVASQMGALAASTFFLFQNKDLFGLEFSVRVFRISRKPLMVIIKQGIPRILQSILISSSILWVNANINDFGMTAATTNSIGNKVQNLINVFVHGIDASASSTVAQCMGAGKTKRVKKVVYATLGCSISFATLNSVLILTFPRQIFGLLTSEPDVIEFGVVYLQILVITLYMAALLGTFHSVVTGAGYASLAFVCGILDGVICRIGFSLLFVNVMHMGPEGYFLAHAMARSFAIVICVIYFYSGKWEKRKLLGT